MIEMSGEGVGLEECLVFGACTLVGARLNVDAGALAELAHRFRKAHAVHLHQEVEDVPAFAAAETVVRLAVGTDDETGRALLVERAQAFVVGAGALEIDVGADHFHHVGAVAHLLDDVLWDGHAYFNRAMVTPVPPSLGSP
jgi:hypothetical protein